MQLSDPVSSLPGIGDKTAAILEKYGITTVSDLLTTYPRIYRQYQATTIAEAPLNEWVIIRGTFDRVNSHHTGRVSTQVTTLTDYKGDSLAVRFFNMPYLSRSLDTTATYDAMGRLTEFAGRRQIVSPELHKISPDKLISLQAHKLFQPIYRSFGTLKSGMLRRKIGDTLSILPELPETLSLDLTHKYNLISRDQAIRHIHLPADEASLELAIRRLSWEELYQLQLDNLRESKRASVHRTTEPLNYDSQRLNEFLSSLPYTPTNSQSAAIKEIAKDLQEPVAMHRLLQGEVGSGKTLVAAAATLMAKTAGKKTLILAPTLILAEQLYENLRVLLSSELSLALYTKSVKGSLDSDVIVGTHAVLRAKDALTNVGLVIVDEQHRFGVEDREALLSLSPRPHQLMMTATPIPRSLAMTVFHYLDLTRLTDLPAGRLPVKTYLVGENKRADAYRWISSEIKGGNQVFIVTPLIEMAEEAQENALKSVKELEVSLKKHFPGVNIDILHGKLKDSDKTARLQAFRSGATQILVATSMIEVGIDIPSANIIVIENAERFGLAQLHQLRGRVGRGGGQGHCLLFSSSKSDKSRDRLTYFVGEKDGEKLAQYDLTHRGPGELYGTDQSGFFNLKVGNLWDTQMLEETYQAAKEYC